MISLNLLPPDEKKEAEIKRGYLFIKNGLLIFFIVMLITTAVALASKIILINELATANNQVALVNSTQLKSQQKIVLYNEKLSKLEAIQTEFTPWSVIIEKIFAELPNGITITNLTLDATSQSMTIEGKAINRDILLTLDENLKQNPLFISPYLPLKNKLLKKDIDFSINSGISLENLKLYEDKSSDQ